MIGNIFGELIAASATGDEAARLRAELGLPPVAQGRTVAVFDTTFIDTPYAATTYDDAIDFLEDLLAVVPSLDAEDRVLVKPSKHESWFVDPAFPWSSPTKGEVVVGLQRRLAADPHVVWLGDDADTVAVSAVADLTITHCFSSPTADVIAAGRPALWYEASDRLRDYPLDRAPGLVVHGRDELLATFLAVAPGRAPGPDDTPELRALVDPHLDGRALTRLRDLLSTDAPRGDVSSASGRTTRP